MRAAGGRSTVAGMHDVLFILACALTILAPLHWVVMRELRLLEDPRHLRDSGVVILRAEAIEWFGEVIGRFADAPIYASLVFKGMRYEFDCVAPAGHRVGEKELYLAPGLLYRTGGTPR